MSPVTVTGLDVGFILAEAARLREDPIKDKRYRSTPIGQLAGRYLDECAFANQSPRTIENREQTLAWLSLDLADRTAADVTPLDLKEFLHRHWRDASVNTRVQHTSNVRVFFAWAHDQGWIPEDPARRLRSPRQKDTERRAHSQETIRRLIVAQDQLRDRVALLLLYWCALRRNELRQVRFRHLDLAARALTVFGKGGSVVEQNVPEPVALLLERHIQDRQAGPDEYLLYPQKLRRFGAYPLYRYELGWDDRLRPLSLSGIDKWWQRCLRNADLAQFPMHELRHSAGTHFHMAGHDLVATQHFMRHRSAATTERTYIHLDRARAIAEVQRRMADPLEGEGS